MSRTPNDIDLSILRRAFREYKATSTAQLTNLKQKLDTFDSLTISEQQTLHQILKPHYTQLVKIEQAKTQKQGRVLEVLKNMCAVARITRQSRSITAADLQRRPHCFTIDELQTTVNELHDIDIKYITVNRLVDSLVRQNYLYIVAEGAAARGQGRTYSFVELLNGRKPPTLNERRKLIGQRPLKDGDIPDAERLEKNRVQEEGNTTRQTNLKTFREGLTTFLEDRNQDQSSPVRVATAYEQSLNQAPVTAQQARPAGLSAKRRQYYQPQVYVKKKR